MKKILFLLSLLMMLNARAQEAKVRPRFSSINSVGILEGEAGTRFHLQTVNGLSSGNWFAGVGTGVDYYMRSIPLFLDVRKSFGKGSTLPFAYVNGGVHFPWQRVEHYYRTEYSTGLYYDFGAGFQIGLNKRNALVFSAGYTYKRYTEERYFAGWCINPPCAETRQHYAYALRRLAIRAGWRFQ